MYNENVPGKFKPRITHFQMKRKQHICKINSCITQYSKHTAIVNLRYNNPSVFCLIYISSTFSSSSRLTCGVLTSQQTRGLALQHTWWLQVRLLASSIEYITLAQSFALSLNLLFFHQCVSCVRARGKGCFWCCDTKSSWGAQMVTIDTKT